MATRRDAAAIAEAERASGIAFDGQLRRLYELLDGSDDHRCVLVLTDEPTGCSLLSLRDVLRLRPQRPLPWSEPFHFRGRLVAPDRRVQPVLAHPRWLPIAEFNGGSTVVFFDGAPTSEGTYGQVVAYQHDPDAVYWIAPSVAGFLAQSDALLERRLDGGDSNDHPGQADESPTPTRTTTCVCRRFNEPPLDIGALWERVTRTPEIKASFAHVAHLTARGLSLYRCVACEASWQGSGGEDPSRAYVQRVPHIGPGEWQEQPFQQAWEVALYRDARNRWLAAQHAGTGVCRVPGCGRVALRFSLECLEHELAGLHARGVLRVPEGRPWPA